ncbi:MAG: uracil-DNA glycosylase family protein, partial [Flavobacteriales bacterium]
VQNYQQFLPEFFVLPHPSPRNRFWMQKNPWFEKNVIPELQERVASIIKTENSNI